MNSEIPKQYTSAEIAQLNKKRAISDGELLKNGAEFVHDGEAGQRLEVTQDQLAEIHAEMAGFSVTGFNKYRKELIRSFRATHNLSTLEGVVSAFENIKEHFDLVPIERAESVHQMSLLVLKNEPAKAILLWNDFERNNSGRVSFRGVVPDIVESKEYSELKEYLKSAPLSTGQKDNFVTEISAEGPRDGAFGMVSLCGCSNLDGTQYEESTEPELRKLRKEEEGKRLVASLIEACQKAGVTELAARVPDKNEVISEELKKVGIITVDYRDAGVYSNKARVQEWGNKNGEDTFRIF